MRKPHEVCCPPVIAVRARRSKYAATTRRQRAGNSQRRSLPRLEPDGVRHALRSSAAIDSSRTRRASDAERSGAAARHLFGWQNPRTGRERARIPMEGGLVASVLWDELLPEPARAPRG